MIEATLTGWHIPTCEAQSNKLRFFPSFFTLTFSFIVIVALCCYVFALFYQTFALECVILIMIIIVIYLLLSGIFLFNYYVKQWFCS